MLKRLINNQKLRFNNHKLNNQRMMKALNKTNNSNNNKKINLCIPHLKIKIINKILRDKKVTRKQILINNRIIYKFLNKIKKKFKVIKNHLKKRKNRIKMIFNQIVKLMLRTMIRNSWNLIQMKN
jgi:hypothetical protein